MSPPAIDRGFVRLAEGLVHYRHVRGSEAGATSPLLLIHGGPGSSVDLIPLMTALSSDRRTVAPDLMGMGESDPSPADRAGIDDHAERLVALLDHLGIGQIDLYGHHSGAQIACEIAIAYPDRVRRLILDGVGLFSEAERAEFLDRYAPPIAPDATGGHLRTLWTFMTNTTVYFPYYSETAECRIVGGAARPPEVLTDKAADVLKNWRTGHLLYQAAFRHDLRGRLPLIRTRTLVLEVSRDPLAPYAAEAASLVPLGTLQVTMPVPSVRATTIESFLNSVDHQEVL